MITNTTSAEFFEEKYRAEADPWNFAGSAYELGRYAATIQALADRRYRNGFEPGCSVGVLTEKLAALCDHIEAVDFAPTAIEAARQRCAALPHVTFQCTSLTDRLPVRGFDLIVLSEMGYYFTPEQWRATVKSLVDTAEPGTTMLAVHWIGRWPDHLMSGDEVHAILRENSALRLMHEERHEHFRLDRWERL